MTCSVDVTTWYHCCSLALLLVTRLVQILENVELTHAADQDSSQAGMSVGRPAHLDTADSHKMD